MKTKKTLNPLPVVPPGLALTCVLSGCQPEAAEAPSTTAARPPVNVAASLRAPVGNPQAVKAPHGAPAWPETGKVRVPRDRRFSFLIKVRPGRTYTEEYRIVRHDSLPTPAIWKHVMEHTLKEVKQGRFRWELSSSSRAVDLGPREYAPGAGLDENRLSIWTLDRHGNLLSVQGERPEAELHYDTLPRVPVKVGDTWKSYSLAGSARTDFISRLKYIARIRGREYGVIEYRSVSGGKKEGQFWMDLQEGLHTKAVVRGETTDYQGQPLTYMVSGGRLDKNGVRIIP